MRKGEDIGRNPLRMLPEVERLVDEAARAVMAVYGRSEIARLEKDDRSPVTEADHAAEAIIVAGLEKLAPAIPVVAEEAVAAGHVPDIGAGPFWLVDPLDGTREFLSRNGEFTVNVALVENAVPTLGVVAAPALARVYTGLKGGPARETADGASREIRCRDVPAEGAIVVASRSHGDSAELDSVRARMAVAGVRAMGSSLKFCLVAAGEADVYPRFGPTMEWDTAAAHAVLLAAGGEVYTLEGAPLRYGKPGFRNPAFVAEKARR